MESKFHLVKALVMQDGGASISLEYQEAVGQPAVARVVLFDKIVYEGGPATAFIEFNKILKSYLSRSRPESSFIALKLKPSEVLGSRDQRRKEEALSG